MSAQTMDDPELFRVARQFAGKPGDSGKPRGSIDELYLPLITLRLFFIPLPAA